MKSNNEKIRNIAIIAHVDHGKTTLVDHLFKQGGIFREGQVSEDRLMDNMDLERERGITIAAKNCSVEYSGIKINIIDTPGHADFGGEVERSLMMVDGAILLVDSAEGPLPQTRFVLRKALERRLALIVVINKIDRKDARPKEVLDQVYELFMDLDASNDQLDFPVLYAVGRDGRAQLTLEENNTDLKPLFDTIIKTVPGPSYVPEQPFQMMVLNLGYSEYLGRLAVGRVMQGSVKTNEKLANIGRDGVPKPLRVVKLQTYKGISFEEITEATPGEIVILAGVENVEIGDTICTLDKPVALPRIVVDEPTIAMRFMANTSPLSGKEGKIVQSQKIRDRLFKETLSNVALKVEETEEPDTFLVKGRGEFQMAIVIETMRREGFELAVARPKVITKMENGIEVEPVEHLIIDCDEAFIGVVTQKLALRKGRMTNLVTHPGSTRARMEFSIPSRGLIGYRGEFLTDTRGTGIMNSYLQGYEPLRGDIVSRQLGSLVSDRAGNAVPYGLFNLEPRGRLFIRPQDAVYEGMVVGEHNRDNDLNVNVCREKKLTNIRAAGRDENVTLTPVVPMNLEQALEFIRDDELVEITPLNIRMRKMILPANLRK
jgi:GTP-binding protein